MSYEEDYMNPLNPFDSTLKDVQKKMKQSKKTKKPICTAKQKRVSEIEEAENISFDAFLDACEKESLMCDLDEEEQSSIFDDEILDFDKDYSD